MISIVMPVFNRAKIINRSIKSILAQTYSDYELIIVDDCSTDNTVEIINKIKDARIRIVLLEKNSGANKARNVGVSVAIGEVIAFMDSDDIWKAEKLEKTLSFLKKNNADVVFHAYKRIFPNGNTDILPHYNLNTVNDRKHHILYENCMATPTIVGYRKVFIEEPFDENMPKFQDWELAIRLVDKYNVLFLDKVLLKANVESNGLTMDMGKSVKALKRIMKKNKDYFNNDDELAAKYYGLLGDFIDRSIQEKECSFCYYAKSLKRRFDKKILVKYILARLGINRNINLVRSKLKITY